jgi:hypothetical protein
MLPRQPKPPIGDMHRILLKFIPILVVGGLIQLAINAAMFSVDPAPTYAAPSEESKELVAKFESDRQDADSDETTPCDGEVRADPSDLMDD